MSYQFELALPIFASFDGTNDIISQEEDFQSRLGKDIMILMENGTFEPTNKTIIMTRDEMVELYILYILYNICIIAFIFVILGTFL